MKVMDPETRYLNGANGRRSLKMIRLAVVEKGECVGGLSQLPSGAEQISIQRDRLNGSGVPRCGKSADLQRPFAVAGPQYVDGRAGHARRRTAARLAVLPTGSRSP